MKTSRQIADAVFSRVFGKTSSAYPSRNPEMLEGLSPVDSVPRKNVLAGSKKTAQHFNKYALSGNAVRGVINRHLRLQNMRGYIQNPAQLLDEEIALFTKKPLLFQKAHPQYGGDVKAFAADRVRLKDTQPQMFDDMAAELQRNYAGNARVNIGRDPRLRPTNPYSQPVAETEVIPKQNMRGREQEPLPRWWTESTDTHVGRTYVPPKNRSQVASGAPEGAPEGAAEAVDESAGGILGSMKKYPGRWAAGIGGGALLGGYMLSNRQPAYQQPLNTSSYPGMLPYGTNYDLPVGVPY